MVSTIDISSLLGGAGPLRDGVDAAIIAAASDTGFMVITGLPVDADLSATDRAQLLRIFGLPCPEIRKLWRQKFDAANPNVYRGWFPTQTGHATYKQGIDIGPDIARAILGGSSSDPLCEPTPLPAEQDLPGWRAAAAAYHAAIERVAGALMRSVARGLGLDETTFDAAFHGGISTLRLIHYPLRDAASMADARADEIWVEHDGVRRNVVGRPHRDTGFMTLLAQDGVPGLQALRHDGQWIDVPPRESALAVNFGQVLERWTGGRIRATEHRVLGSDRERHSIPFFYEPRVDAEIAPLPIKGAEPFEPFLFGDHLWETTTKFVEFHGLEYLRTPRRTAA